MLELQECINKLADFKSKFAQEIDMNEKIFPIIGPSSEAEAIESINKFEENLKNGQVHWTSSEEFDRQLFEEFPWLR